VAHLIDKHHVSQQRTREVLKEDRSTIRYHSKRLDDFEQCEAIKRIAKERRRFGYRWIDVMLQRQGIHMNHKKLQRMGGRKRALGTRIPIEGCQMAQTSAGALILSVMHSPITGGSVS